MWNCRTRFSLRTLLLMMAVLCCLAAMVGYEINWIEQRRQFRERPKFSFIESRSDRSDQPRAPQLLWLFGEPGVAFMTMELLDEDVQCVTQGDRELKAVPKMNVNRAHVLFPEATIYSTDETGDVVENLGKFISGRTVRASL